MTSEHPPTGDPGPVPPGPVPPGPVIEPEPQRKTGGLSVEEWIEENRKRSMPEGPADLYRDPSLGREPRPRANQTMAGWALGLSLAFCIPFGFLVAVGLAVTVLIKGRDGRDHGQGKAIAALVISGLIVMGNIVYVVVVVLAGFDDTDRDSAGNVVDGGSVSVDKLRTGDCFSEPNLEDLPDDGSEGEASAVVDVVPCDEPHQAENYHQITLDDGDYPGSKAIDARAVECLSEFRAYVGVAYERSDLEFVYYFPSPRTWRFGDREILCNIVNRDLSDLTDTVEGSRR